MTARLAKRNVLAKPFDWIPYRKLWGVCDTCIFLTSIAQINRGSSFL